MKVTAIGAGLQETAPTGSFESPTNQGSQHVTEHSYTHFGELLAKISPV